jgi:tetratricopeptide (TPR) repeat protein
MKGSVKNLLVSGMVVLATAGQLVAQTAQDAWKLLDAEQFSKSKATLDGLLAASPTADNQFNLGYYFLRVGQLDAAKAAFDKGQATDPKNALCAVGQAAIKLAKNDLAGAKVMIDKAIADTKSKNADVLYRSAEAYSMFKDKTQANDVAEAVKLIDLIPERTKKSAPEYQIVKGDAYLIKNEGGPAVSAYEQALLLDPKNARALTKIAVVYKLGKNFKESQNYFKRAIEADSNYAPVYQEYGDYFIRFSQYKLAAEQFKKYLTKAEATAENKIKTAKLLFISKDYEGARKLIDEAASALKQDDMDVPRMQGYIEYEKGSHAKALEILNGMESKYGKEKIKMLDMSYIVKANAKANKDTAKVISMLTAFAPVDTNDNMYIYLYDIFNKKKDFKAASIAQKQAIDWKNAKFGRTSNREFEVKSGDFFTLGRASYFVAAYARDTAKKVRDERYTYALKADTAFAKAIEKNAEWPMYSIWRARSNTYADTARTLWSAVPHYDKAIEVSDKLAADSKGKLDKQTLFEIYKYYVGYYTISDKKDPLKAVEYAKKGLEIKPDDKDLNEVVNPSAGMPATPVPPPANGAKPGGGVPK